VSSSQRLLRRSLSAETLARIRRVEVGTFNLTNGGIMSDNDCQTDDGVEVVTRGEVWVSERAERHIWCSNMSLDNLLQRHRRGDWGEVSQSRRERNNRD